LFMRDRSDARQSDRSLCEIVCGGLYFHGGLYFQHFQHVPVFGPSHPFPKISWKAKGQSSPSEADERIPRPISCAVPTSNV
jgi:hypothetical protein